MAGQKIVWVQNAKIVWISHPCMGRGDLLLPELFTVHTTLSISMLFISSWIQSIIQDPHSSFSSILPFLMSDHWNIFFEIFSICAGPCVPVTASSQDEMIWEMFIWWGPDTLATNFINLNHLHNHNNKASHYLPISSLSTTSISPSPPVARAWTNHVREVPKKSMLQSKIIIKSRACSDF